MLQIKNLLHIDQMLQRARTTREYYVKPYVPSGSIISIYGASNSGKSFFAVELGLVIASGSNLHGFEHVTKAVVLFVAAEGDMATQRRVKAWTEHNKISTCELADFWTLIGPELDLASEKDAEFLLEVCQSLGVKVLIIDSLTHGLLNQDTNSGAAYGAAFKSINRVMAHSDVSSVILISHMGKDKSKDQRGHSIAGDVPDMTLKVTGESGKGFTVDFAKQRDGSLTESITFEFRKAADCDPDEAPWLERVSVPVDGATRWTPQQRQIIECLLRALQGHGIISTGPNNTLYRRLHRSLAIKALKEAELHLTATGAPQADNWFAKLRDRKWFQDMFEIESEFIQIGEDRLKSLTASEQAA